MGWDSSHPTIVSVVRRGVFPHRAQRAVPKLLFGVAPVIGEPALAVRVVDSLAAGDLYRLSINRDANGSAITDSATGDAYVLAVELRDGA